MKYHQREIGEFAHPKRRILFRIKLPFCPDILKIVISIIGMQLHTLLNSILASTQLHDYDHIALFQILFQILRSHNAGNHHQTLLLFDNMQSGNCSRGDESRYSCCPFHLKTAVNQFVIYILDRRIKARISFCYYHHIPTFS